MYLFSISCLGFVSVVSWYIWNSSVPELDTTPIIAKAGGVKKIVQSNAQVEVVDSLELGGKHWTRAYRRPLYDPPPVVKTVVKKKPRPITFRVTGTILEPDNPQAIISLRTGDVRILRVGSQVSDDPLDGTITSISSEKIMVKRRDDEVTVAVE